MLLTNGGTSRIISREIDPKGLWNIKSKRNTLNSLDMLANDLVSKFNAEAVTKTKATAALVQYYFQAPFEFKVVYHGKGKKFDWDSDRGDALLKRRQAAFHRRFTRRFPKIRSEWSAMAKAALSNLLGGITYFYGPGLQWTMDRKEIVETEPYELFTDVPSRSTFPRGFLWDSGFHNLIIHRWDPKLSLRIIRNWAMRVDGDGWIAREQIPGEEARSKVPPPYRVQDPRYANPPSMLLPLLALAHDNRDPQALQDIYHGFKKNLSWYLRTQRGLAHPSLKPTVKEMPLFRWRGRHRHHTLTSGLDDYPRGPFPNRWELHVDLIAWMALAARTMIKLQRTLGLKDDMEEYAKLYDDCLRVIEEVHWDEERGCYTDLTVDSKGRLVPVKHTGYVSLFPLLLGLINPNSPRLGRLLDIIEDPGQLWTDYGIRSLARNDSAYLSVDQYWTGPIWINMNYLLLASLKEHVNTGPFKERVANLYRRLRANLIDNMVGEYQRNGFIWEQYSDNNGHGQRAHPFTGWSALIILIMAEEY